MPAYSNAFPPNSVDRGDLQSVWTTADGTFASGTKTQRVALCQRPDGGATKLTLQVIFSAGPGVISLQPQTSDTDSDADFQSEGAALTVLGNNNEVRAEFPSIAARYARLLATTVTNAVSATVNFGG